MVGALAIGMAGCAKLPEAGSGTRTTRVLFTVDLAGEVNPNYVYIVALRPSIDTNPIELGPIPVIAPPWGNGFVVGDVSHFVRWSQDQSPRYQVYAFQGGNLLNFVATGVPINSNTVGTGTRSLQFEVDMLQFSGSIEEARIWQTLQVNLLTMDRVPQGSSGTKNWDALGDGRLPTEVNTPINIPLRTAGTYDNARFANLEPTDDVVDPALDITNFRIEVRPE